MPSRALPNIKHKTLMLTISKSALGEEEANNKPFSVTRHVRLKAEIGMARILITVVFVLDQTIDLF